MKQILFNSRVLFQGLYRRWREYPGWMRQFSVNVVIGMAIVLWIHLNTDAALVEKQQNRGLDWLSRMVTNTSLAPQPDQPLFMVNVDAPTYSRWGEPWLTPADKLASLLSLLLQAEPAQILVDFDFSRRDDLQPLLDVLAEYSGSEFPATQIVFMKTQALMRPGGSVLPAFRDSALDPLVASNSHLHWAAPLFRPDRDGVIRNWQLLVGGCKDQRLTLLPSVQLLSVLLSHDRLPADYASYLSPGSKRDCRQLPNFSGRVKLSDDKTIRFSGSDLDHRIVYALPPDPKEGYLSIPWKGIQLPALTQVSAGEILKAGAVPASGMLQGSIVILGATHRDSGDIHKTPLGNMPGAMVLANSITALQGLDQVERPSLWLILGIELLLVLITSWLFMRMSSFLATLVSAGLVIVVVVPLSLLAFSQGVWLDFALPVLAVQFRSLVSETGEELMAVRKKKE